MDEQDFKALLIIYYMIAEILSSEFTEKSLQENNFSVWCDPDLVQFRNGFRKALKFELELNINQVFPLALILA